MSAVLLPRILLRQPEHLHQANQAADRAAVGPAYKDSGLVFTHPDGSPIHPHLFSDWFITMDTYSHLLPGLDERAATTVARLILEGHEPEPNGSIDKPLTTGHVVPSTLDSPEGGEARNARSDG